MPKAKKKAKQATFEGTGESPLDYLKEIYSRTNSENLEFASAKKFRNGAVVGHLFSWNFDSTTTDLIQDIPQEIIDEINGDMILGQWIKLVQDPVEAAISFAYLDNVGRISNEDDIDEMAPLLLEVCIDYLCAAILKIIGLDVVENG